MKVGILSPACWSTPPKKYGPWEQVTSNIAEGLVKKGFEVTLFATSDSRTKGKLDWICEKPYAENSELDPKVCECMHIGNFMEKAHQFDILHNNYDFLPLTYSGLVKTPMITTIHGFSSPKIIPVFEKYNKHNHYVSISNSDRSDKLDYIATVYNGIDTSEFTFKKEHGDYLLFFGRIHPEKGTLEAIEIAKKAKMKLIISGLIQDQKYYDELIKPHINAADIVYVGNSESKKRDDLLRNAYALLHPISFAEPFGLSVAESMICGTPVIAFNLGSMPELIIDSKTGFIVNNINQAVEVLPQIKNLDREFTRKHAVQNFSMQRMIENYIKVYTKILN